MRRLCLSILLLTACDGGLPAGTDPEVVTLGETTFVVVMNPPINDATQFGLPEPGPEQLGVEVTDADTGNGGATGRDGVVVIGLPDGGDRRLDLDGPGFSDFIRQPIARQSLVEVAIAASEDRISAMRRLEYPFASDNVVTLTPEMGIDAVNAALAVSGAIALLGGGVYEGDLVFAGSGVTLFGEGETGGRVTIRGNVSVTGSGARIRGAHITGDVTLLGAESSLSFTRVDGTLTVMSSNSVLLVNRLCGDTSVVGTGTVALGNHGLAPLPEDGC